MRVALFVTCLTDTFLPRVGEAVVRVLRHFGCEVTFPAGQTCCGQPAFNSGFHDDARAVARRTIEVFEPCETIVSPSASCVTMIRHHYAELFESEPAWAARAARLAAKTFEFATFLRDRLKVDIAGHLRGREPLTYHYPCHAREIHSCSGLVQMLARDGVELRHPAPAELCCGFGGAFAVEFPQISGAMLTDKLATLRETGARLVVCNEGGCALHLMGGARRAGLDLRFRHVAELLAESLGLMEPADE